MTRQEELELDELEPEWEPESQRPTRRWRAAEQWARESDAHACANAS